MNPSPASKASAKGHASSRSATGPGRPKDLGKRNAILDAAKSLFVQEGYGVSMDQIAAAAGVSKLTVYSHFGDKDGLFSAAISSECEAMLPRSLFELELQGPLRDQLLVIARAFFALVSNDQALCMHRMLLAPARTDDKPLRELFWKAGAQPTVDALVTLLQPRAEAGELAIDDLPRAARQFFCLVKGEPHHRLLFGLDESIAAEEVEAHLQATVDFFLRGYRPQ